MRNDTSKADLKPQNWFNAMTPDQRIKMFLKFRVVIPRLIIVLNDESVQLPKSMRDYYINMLNRIINVEQYPNAVYEIDDNQIKKVAKYIVSRDMFLGSPMQLVKLIAIFYKRRKPASKKIQNIVQDWS